MPPILAIGRRSANAGSSSQTERTIGCVQTWMRMTRFRADRIPAVLALVALVMVSLSTGTLLAQTPPPAQPGARTFTDQDAASLMDRFRQALQSGNRSRTLKLFDNVRMPGFPVFRDELSQFFARYQPPTSDYRISQISQDGALGAVVAEFTMEAVPWTDGQPVLHRRTQVRLVTSWDGKEWKIADLSPRSLFQ
jgi:hypothetical protein